MDTLEYIVQKFNINLEQKSPITIENINRRIMAETLTELNFNVGAEVGVEKGLHAELLCQTNPNLKLYCVDVWEPYSGYNEYINRIGRYYKESVERLKNYNCVLVKKFSMDAAKDFEDNSLDFVYIDAAHDFKHVAEDINDWTKKVKIGGIVYGHDYKRSARKKYIVDVKDVVPAFCYAKGIRPWFILGQRGPADGLYREGTQSWMFVKLIDVR